MTGYDLQQLVEEEMVGQYRISGDAIAKLLSSINSAVAQMVTQAAGKPWDYACTGSGHVASDVTLPETGPLIVTLPTLVDGVRLGRAIEINAVSYTTSSGVTQLRLLEDRGLLDYQRQQEADDGGWYCPEVRSNETIITIVPRPSNAGVIRIHYRAQRVKLISLDQPILIPPEYEQALTHLVMAKTLWRVFPEVAQFHMAQYGPAFSLANMRRQDQGDHSPEYVSPSYSFE